jgi:hypothetical protein
MGSTSEKGKQQRGGRPLTSPIAVYPPRAIELAHQWRTIAAGWPLTFYMHMYKQYMGNTSEKGGKKRGGRLLTPAPAVYPRRTIERGHQWITIAAGWLLTFLCTSRKSTWAVLQKREKTRRQAANIRSHRLPAGRRPKYQRRAIGGTATKAGRCLSHAQAPLVLPIEITIVDFLQSCYSFLCWRHSACLSGKSFSRNDEISHERSMSF